MANPLAGELGNERSRTGDLVGSFALSYLVAFLLIAALVYFGDVWEVVANSRFLDFLIRVGIVKYHDKNIGFVGVSPTTSSISRVNFPSIGCSSHLRPVSSSSFGSSSHSSSTEPPGFLESAVLSASTCARISTGWE